MSRPDRDRGEPPVVGACRSTIEVTDQADRREAGVLEQTDRLRLRVPAGRGGATVVLGFDRDAVLNEFPAIFRRIALAARVEIHPEPTPGQASVGKRPLA